MKSASIVAKKLEDILRRKGISQKELAEQAGVWPQQVNSWIKGRDNISARNLRKIASVLDVKIEELTTEAEAMAGNSSLEQADFLQAMFLTLNRIETKLDGFKSGLAVEDSSQLMYEVLFNKFPWGVIVSELDGKIIFVNDKVCSLSGYTREEFLNAQAGKYYVRKEDRIRLMSIMKKNDVVYNFETEMIGPDGTTAWANVNMKKMWIHGKEYLISLVEDITEIKKAMGSSSHKEKA